MQSFAGTMNDITSLFARQGWTSQQQIDTFVMFLQAENLVSSFRRYLRGLVWPHDDQSENLIVHEQEEQLIVEFFYADDSREAIWLALRHEHCDALGASYPTRLGPTTERKTLVSLGRRILPIYRDALYLGASASAMAEYLAEEIGPGVLDFTLDMALAHAVREASSEHVLVVSIRDAHLASLLHLTDSEQSIVVAIPDPDEEQPGVCLYSLPAPDLQADRIVATRRLAWLARCNAGPNLVLLPSWRGLRRVGCVDTLLGTITYTYQADQDIDSPEYVCAEGS